MVIAEFSVTPVGSEEQRPYVDAAIDEVKKSGLHYEVEAMGTTVQGEITQVLNVVMRAHQAVKGKGVGRVITEIRIDDQAEEASIEQQVEGYRASV